MKISNQMKEHFVSDYNLPIQVFSEPHFQYYIGLLDPYYNSIAKYDLLKDAICLAGNEETLMEQAHKFKRDVETHIECHPEYIRFTNRDMSMFNPVFSLNKGNLYQESNKDKRFVSLDLIEANFQSLRFIDPSILMDEENYIDFASNFTDSSYIQVSKKIRQIIFGQLTPSRQQTIQKYIISNIVKKLMTDLDLGRKLISTSSDEIVFESTHTREEVNNIVKEISGIYGLHDIRLKAEIFTLSYQGTPKYKFFVKHMENGKRSIKGVDSAYIAETIKFLEGRHDEVIPDLDRLFFNNNRLCQFKESLF